MKTNSLFTLLTKMMIAALSIGFVSCSGSDSDGDTPSVKSITLAVGETQNLGFSGTFSSDNPFIAIANNQGEVKGYHVGKTFINSGSKRIPVTVIGKNHIIDDPVMDWGCTPSTVKTRQKQGTLKSESATAIAYEKVGSAEGLIYTFANNKLTAVGIAFKVAYSLTVADYLSEHFLMIPYSGSDKDMIAAGYDAISADDATTIVGYSFMSNPEYVMVTIAPKGSK